MSVSECNELTVKIKCELDEFYKILETKGFEAIENFTMDDTFFIPNTLDIKKMTVRDILSKAVIVRIVNRSSGVVVKNITFKHKEFDDEGNISYQNKVQCDVENTEDAKKLLIAMGYKELMNIKESDIVYQKGDLQFAVKDIKDGDKLIEVEPKYNTKESLEKLKEKLSEHDLPIYTDNYFVKKAEIMLSKILGK